MVVAMNRLPNWSLACVLVPTACGSAGEGDATFTVRDSAGIEIVENIGPAWQDGSAWRIDSIPSMDVNERDDDALHRIGSARILADGGLAFFNGGSCEVRFHGETGALVSSAGRCGEGPGEFEESARIWPWRGDSILVVDRLTRVTVLGRDGTHGRTTQLRTTTEMPLPMVRGVLADGTIVVGGLRNPAGRASPGIEAGETLVGLLAALDATPQLIGTFPGPVFEYTEFNGSLGRGALAFSSSTQFASGDDRVYVGYPDRFEIHAHGTDGALKRIIRRTYSPVTVEQRDIDWLMERRLTQVEGEENQRAVRQAYRDIRHAPVMPTFGTPVWPGGADGGPAMLVDEEENLWIFQHYRPGEYRNDWTVFSSDGVWQGIISLPENLTPSQIGPDFVIGSWTDETGFVHIRRYRLIKS